MALLRRMGLSEIGAGFGMKPGIRPPFAESPSLIHSRPFLDVDKLLKVEGGTAKDSDFFPPQAGVTREQ